MNLCVIHNLGDILDKIPEWIHFILAIILFLYFIQIIIGLFAMSDHFHYPGVKINKEVDEWTPIVWLPLKLYYVLIFTNKLKYRE